MFSFEQFNDGPSRSGMRTNDDDSKKEYDPLLPFLGPHCKSITKEQALHAKEECLKGLKRSLLKRMEIINVKSWISFDISLLKYERRLHAEEEILESKRNQLERSQASNLEKCAQVKFLKFQQWKNILLEERELEILQEESDFRTKIIKARLALVNVL